MIRISSRIDSEELRRVRSLFGNLESETRKMSVEATNKVAENLKDFASQYASEEYYITKREVAENINIFWASKSKTHATLNLRGRKFSLQRFANSSSRTQTLNSGILRGNLAPIKRAWKMTSSRNGETHIFAVKKKFLNDPKEARKKENITVLRGVSIPEMLGTSRAVKKFDAKVKQELERELGEGFNRVLRG